MSADVADIMQALLSVELQQEDKIWVSICEDVFKPSQSMTGPSNSELPQKHPVLCGLRGMAEWDALARWLLNLISRGLKSQPVLVEPLAWTPFFESMCPLLILGSLQLQNVSIPIY